MKTDPNPHNEPAAPAEVPAFAGSGPCTCCMQPHHQHTGMVLSRDSNCPVHSRPLPVSDWLPIEKAPRDGTWIIGKYFNMTCECAWDGKEWIDRRGIAMLARNPSHFRPLHPTPEAGARETPLTDAEAYQDDNGCPGSPADWIVPADFASRLERERDEARENNDRNLEILTEQRKKIDVLRSDLTASRAEAEGLRAQVADWHRVADDRTAEIVRLGAEAEGLRRERDEAEAKGFKAGKNAQAILEVRARAEFIAEKKKELCAESETLRAQLAAKSEALQLAILAHETMQGERDALKKQNDPLNTGMTGEAYRERMQEWKTMCIRERKELATVRAQLTTERTLREAAERERDFEKESHRQTAEDYENLNARKAKLHAELRILHIRLREANRGAEGNSRIAHWRLDEVFKLQKELTAAQTALASAREDAARFDEFERRRWSVAWSTRTQEWYLQGPQQVCGSLARAATFRGVIDAALALLGRGEAA